MKEDLSKSNLCQSYFLNDTLYVPKAPFKYNMKYLNAKSETLVHNISYLGGRSRQI